MKFIIIAAFLMLGCQANCQIIVEEVSSKKYNTIKPKPIDTTLSLNYERSANDYPSFIGKKFYLMEKFEEDINIPDFTELRNQYFTITDFFFNLTNQEVEKLTATIPRMADFYGSPDANPHYP